MLVGGGVGACATTGVSRMRAGAAGDVVTVGIALQLTPEVPSDATYPAYREARERVIDHLGRDAFIDGPLVVPLEPYLLPVEPTAARVPVLDFPASAGQGEAGGR